MSIKRVVVVVIIASVLVTGLVGLFVLPDIRSNTVVPQDTGPQTVEIVEFNTRAGGCSAEFVGTALVRTSSENTLQIKGTIVTTDDGRQPVVEEIIQAKNTTTVRIGATLTRDVTNSCPFYSTYTLTVEPGDISRPFQVVVRHNGVQENATITESTVEKAG